MLTRKALSALLRNVYLELTNYGLQPERMILFGSYAAGHPHEYSDVDIAIWHHTFTGDHMADFETIRTVCKKFRGIDIKTFPSGAGPEDDPFIQVIEESGIECQFEMEEVRSRENR